MSYFALWQACFGTRSSSDWGMGKSYFSDSPVMLAFSWSILMSLNVIFSNVWGILLKEWKGVDRRTIVVLITGMCILILSLLYPNIV